MSKSKKTSAAKATATQKTAKAATQKSATEKAATPKEGEKKMSLLKAAVAVLDRSEEALGAKQLVERAKADGLWTPGEGKTPEQTLYSAMVREIKTKGENARFAKEGGLFRIKR